LGSTPSGRATQTGSNNHTTSPPPLLRTRKGNTTVHHHHAAPRNRPAVPPRRVKEGRPPPLGLLPSLIRALAPISTAYVPLVVVDASTAPASLLLPDQSHPARRLVPRLSRSTFSVTPCPRTSRAGAPFSCTPWHRTFLSPPQAAFSPPGSPGRRPQRPRSNSSVAATGGGRPRRVLDRGRTRAALLAPG